MPWRFLCGSGVAQLQDHIGRGIALVLTSHYTPEDLKDAETKINYLQKVKEIAQNCKNAEDMKRTMQEEFPGCSGENYMEMTAGFFFPEA